jgi:uncharacterized protein (DUF2267 family)
MMSPTSLFARVAEHTALDEASAQALVDTTLRALSLQLGASAADALAAELPGPLAAGLRGTGHGHPANAEALFSAVRRARRLRRSVAVEQVQVVCQALAGLLGPDALRALQNNLPEDVGALFVEPPRPSPRPSPHLDRARRTLAEGYGGGGRPLFAASPERAQSGSVVRSPNPHGDTKLSTATGLTQEREAETLATAGPEGRLADPHARPKADVPRTR